MIDTHSTTTVDRPKRSLRFIHALLTILLLVASAVLTAAGFAPIDWWWLPWVSLVPLLLALRRISHPLSAALLGLLFGMVLLFRTVPWLLIVFSETLGWVLLFIGSLPFALFAAGTHVVQRHLPVSVQLFALPILWVAADFFRCEGWYFQFSWVQLGQTQVLWPGGMALYPLIGVYGVSQVIMLANVSLLMAFTIRERPVRISAVVTLAGILLLIGLAIPLHNTVRVQDEAKPVTALVVQDERGSMERQLEITYAARNLRPDLVVWRESAAGDLLAYPAQMEKVQQCTRALSCTLVLGCAEQVATDRVTDYNSALIISPTGEILGKYRKRHPVQIMENSITPGTTSPSFATPVGRLGIAICYDFDYAAITWQLVHNGAELLVVPTFDAEGWSDLQHLQHARMAQTRAAEAGRWVLRATSSGISQIISPHGEVVVSAPNRASTTIHATAYPLTQCTLYTSLLYRIPHACVILAILIFATAIWHGIRKRRPPEADQD